MHKQITIIFFLTCVPFMSKSQGAISVPILETLAAIEATERAAIALDIVNQLVEAKKHTEELSKTAKFLEDSYEKLNRVNSFIKELEMVQKISIEHFEVLKDAKEFIENLVKNEIITRDEFEVITDVIEEASVSSLEIVEMLEFILTDESYMSDAERIMLLKQYEKELQEKQTYIYVIIEEYRDIAEVKTLLKVQYNITSRDPWN